MLCAEAREDLTALLDGALDERRAAAVRGHVDDCDVCARERASLATAVDLSRRLLAEVPELRPGFATRLEARLEEIRRPAARPRRWWGPVLAGTMAAGLVLAMASTVGGPSAVLVPLGLQAPPKQVVEKPQLFKDYEIIEHLEELENFETVIQTPLEDELLGQQKGSG